MPAKEKYTDPKLRDQIKEEIHKGDKGGDAGQWTARKAQMMASEYKKRGGDYNTDKSDQDESQKNIENWGNEENEKEDDKKKGGKSKSDDKKSSKKETNSKDAKSKGKQGSETKKSDDKKATPKRGSAKQTRKDADDGEEEEVEEGAEEQDGDSEGEYQDDNGEEEQNEDENEDENEDQENVKPGQKRGRKQSEESSKKQKSNAGNAKAANGKKTVGSKHMDAKEPGKQGSADRPPKKGQTVHWKALPGYVEGKLQEILKKDKTVDGKSFKASEKEPKFVLKSNSSGKICVHKPEACYYD